MQLNNNMANTQARTTSSSMFLDRLAIGGSALCAIHCLTLPILLSVFPALGTTLFGKESFHLLLLVLVIPLSLVALSIGCKQHKSWFVALMGVLGLGLLIFTAIYGHDTFGHEGERIATLFGACLIAFGHIRNYTLCRTAKCNH